MNRFAIGLLAGVLACIAAKDAGAAPAANRTPGRFPGDTGKGARPIVTCDQSGCGTVFAFDLNTGKEKVLHAFQNNGQDGFAPRATLIEFRGKLYGTTMYGGAHDDGTVFSVDPATGREKMLYSFGSYSCGQGCFDGYYPQAGLKRFGTKFYGTTEYGGAEYGTVYSFDPVTRIESLLYYFGEAGAQDGEYPDDSLIHVNGLLYGTNFDTVFSVDPETGVETVLHRFTGGMDVYSGVTNVKGILYGTTASGGSGTVYSVDSVTGAETVLYSFPVGEGSPRAGLRWMSGKLYGTAAASCDSGTSIVFSFDPASGAEKTLACVDDAFSINALIDVGGDLYGASFDDGLRGSGTLFRITKKGAENTLYTFCSRKNCSDGAFPVGGLIQVRNVLYGTTMEGGTLSQSR